MQSRMKTQREKEDFQTISAVDNNNIRRGSFPRLQRLSGAAFESNDQTEV